jgi:AAA family ATP:ADP antiporter
MIGGYWLLRSLKDPVITALCGIQVVPQAKMMSVLVVFGVVSIYNRLLDSDMPKHRLFYLFGTIYFGIFSIIALMLMDKTIGLPNQKANPNRLLGWISYCAIESFGSVMVSLFWSFANSNISLETAKASYGVMVATAQIGSILGPTIVRSLAGTYGVAVCYLMGAFCILLLQSTMYMYISIYGTEERNATPTIATTAPHQKKPPANIWEGLQLFWDHHYVKGIFAISCLFMVIETIVDYIMKVLATDFFATEFPMEDGSMGGISEAATEGFATFMGMFGQATNLLSFLLSLLGTSAVIRYLGLRLTLLLFPVVCLSMVALVRFQPTLYVVFAAMMILKACSYALNNPTKEMLYQPTSSAVRYKAKSWIDIFGGRGSKALGSVVTYAFSQSAESLIANGSLVGMLVSAGLIWNARYMGRKFDEYVASGYVVGAEDSERILAAAKDEQEMAILQNDQPDTSCAILDHDDDDEVGPEEEEGDDDDDDGNVDEDEKGDDDDEQRGGPQVTMV